MSATTCSVPPSAIQDSCPGTCSSPSGDAGTLFLLLINSIVSAKCKFLSANDFAPDISDSLVDGAIFDFIVVGAGSAGSVVATRLTEANPSWKVLLLEAGPLPIWDNEVPALFFDLQGGPLDWAYVSEPQTKSCLGFNGHVSKWPRGKVLGGSSQFNAMLYVRGHEKDYDGWAAQGNAGWAYEDVLPYFIKSETFVGENDGQDGMVHGTNGPLLVSRYISDSPMLPALRGASIQLDKKDLGRDKDGYGLYIAPNTIADGRRASTARCYLTRDAVKSRLQMALHAEVTKVLISDGRATGVIVQLQNGRSVQVQASREIIISAGSVNSPKLLLQSGVHLPGVGRHLQDHLATFLLPVEADQIAPNASSPTILDLTYQYLTRFSGPLSQVGLSNTVWFTNSQRRIRESARLRSLHQPNLQFHFLDFQRGALSDFQVMSNAIGLNKVTSDSIADILAQKRLLVVAVTLLYPKSVGKVTLGDDGQLHIFPNYLTDAGNADLKVMLDGIEFLTEIVQTTAMRSVNARLAHFNTVNCEGMAFGSREYFACAVRNFAATIYHPVGTCKMGQDPSHHGGAVVDEFLKVWGVDGLRVIDASIMPRITGGNTNVPTIMIGEKGSDMIIQAHS